MTSRRRFLKAVGGASLIPILYDIAQSQITTKARPNILCLVSEDNSPFLGCYGDAYADTPNLDRFAQEGILYQNAFAPTMLSLAGIPIPFHFQGRHFWGLR